MAKTVAKKRRMAKPKAAGAEKELEAKRRRQLVRAVVECMSEEGFERTTMRNIADRAGVSIGMLNYYYKSKKELVVEAIRHANDGVQSALTNADAIPYGPRRLEFILRRTLRNEYSESLPLSFRLAVMAAAANDTDLRKQVVGWLEDGRSKFERSIRAGIDSGHYRGDVDPRLLSIVLYGAMTGLAVETAVSPDLLPLDTVVNASLLVLRMFQRDSQAPRRSAASDANRPLPDVIEQQLVADPALHPNQAMAIAAAVRAMYGTMVAENGRKG